MITSVSDFLALVELFEEIPFKSTRILRTGYSGDQQQYPGKQIHLAVESGNEKRGEIADFWLVIAISMLACIISTFDRTVSQNTRANSGVVSCIYFTQNHDKRMQ